MVCSAARLDQAGAAEIQGLCCGVYIASASPAMVREPCCPLPTAKTPAVRLGELHQALGG